MADNFYIQTSEPEVKQRMEELLNEKEIVLNFDEQIEYKGMNAYMNEVVLATFSSFDTGSQPFWQNTARAILSWICI